MPEPLFNPALCKCCKIFKAQVPKNKLLLIARKSCTKPLYSLLYCDCSIQYSIVQIETLRCSYATLVSNNLKTQATTSHLVASKVASKHTHMDCNKTVSNKFIYFSSLNSQWFDLSILQKNSAINLKILKKPILSTL